MCKVPKLVVEGVTLDDMNETEVGNSCFFMACVSLYPCFNLYSKCVKYPNWWLMESRLITRMREKSGGEVRNSWFVTACASLNLCFKFHRNCVKYPKLVIEGVTTDDLNEVEVRGRSRELVVCYSVCQSKSLF